MDIREFKTRFNEAIIIPVKFRLQWLYLQFFKAKDKGDYEYGIGYVLYARNEGPYIQEWIEYHKLISGCTTHFYIYDNRSDDNMKEVLEPYIERGEVSYKYVDAETQPQRQVYTDAIFHHRKECKYMAFIDTDEFIYPLNGDGILNIVDFVIKKYEDKNPAGLYMNWLFFGSSGHETKPQGFVIENYLYRSDYTYKCNESGKVIANPRKLKRMHIHNHEYYSPFITINEQGDKVGWEVPFNKDWHYTYLRLHHYASKSKEEAQKRHDAGYGRRRKNPTAKRGYSNRCSHDLNEVYDDSMLKYTEKLKLIMNKQD